ILLLAPSLLAVSAFILTTGMKRLCKVETSIFSAPPRLRGANSSPWISDYPILHLWCFTLCLVLCSPAHSQTKPAADLIITNAKIWTVDKGHPQAEALAVLRDRIVAVGTNTEVDAWHGPQTKILDAQGKLLLPGFNDAHVHFVDGGDHLQQVQLKDASSPQ